MGRLRYAFVALAVLTVAMTGAAILFTVTYYHREQGAQGAQGAAIEAKLCSSLLPLEGLALLKPPAGNPSTNPSRAFEQQLVAKLAPLAQLGPDLGCGKTVP